MRLFSALTQWNFSPILPAQVFGLNTFRRFIQNRFAVLCLMIVVLYFLIALGVIIGLWAENWAGNDGGQWESPSLNYWFGTNILGQDIFQRALFSTKTAIEIGLIVAIFSATLGAFSGAIAGYYNHTWIDEIILWIMGVLDSVPFYLWVAAFATASSGFAYAMQIAMVLSFWTTTSRLVRGEVMKIKKYEFVAAAKTIGVPHCKLLCRHILPNTLSLVLVQSSIVFVSAIKLEVILSFLGIGVKNEVSWGLMIAESAEEVQAGHYANFVAASLFLMVLVMAFNYVSDALQDAINPNEQRL